MVDTILRIMVRWIDTFKVLSGEHIVVSPLTFKKTKTSKESVICEHLLQGSI